MYIEGGGIVVFSTCFCLHYLKAANDFLIGVIKMIIMTVKIMIPMKTIMIFVYIMCNVYLYVE